MKDVRSKRTADIASDHHYVMFAQMRLKLKKRWATKRTTLQGFNTNFLTDTDKLNYFKIVIIIIIPKQLMGT